MIATLNAVLEEIVRRSEDELNDIVEEMLERIRVEIPEMDRSVHPELAEPMRLSAVGNIRVGAAALRGDRLPPGVLPSEAVEEARLAARNGVPLPQLLRAYRIGHAVMWERAAAAIDELPLSPELRQQALKTVSRFQFRYIDEVADLVGDIYEGERAVWIRSRDQRRTQSVRELLDGVRESDPELGYDVAATHVAAVCWGLEPQVLVADIAERLACGQLSIIAGDGSVWAWFATEREGDAHRHATELSNDDTRVALGDAASGVDGFRASHRQALMAFRVAQQLPQPVTRYDAVALEAAALADESAARRFVERELGPLARSDVRARRLRATLEAYLYHSQVASSAAAVLGVSDRTVAYRLRTCDELLGRSAALRAAELSLALRWGRLLGLFGRGDDQT